MSSKLESTRNSFENSLLKSILCKIIPKTPKEALF